MCVTSHPPYPNTHRESWGAGGRLCVTLLQMAQKDGKEGEKQELSSHSILIMDQTMTLNARFRLNII